MGDILYARQYGDNQLRVKVGKMLPSRDHLEGPRGAERGGWAFDKAAPVRYKKHYHDSPGDSPLLHSNETAALGRRSDFRDIDRDLRRADTNTETVDNATNDEHGDVLRRSGDNRANDPDDCTEHDGFLATKAVRDEARAERGEPGAASHRGGDAALDIRARAFAWDRALVEVVEVVFGGDAVIDVNECLTGEL